MKYVERKCVRSLRFLSNYIISGDSDIANHFKIIRVLLYIYLSLNRLMDDWEVVERWIFLLQSFRVNRAFNNHLQKNHRSLRCTETWNIYLMHRLCEKYESWLKTVDVARKEIKTLHLVVVTWLIEGRRRRKELTDCWRQS